MLFLKASQSLPHTAAKKMKIIFCRGVYLAENTSQAASVEFVPGGDKLCAQQTEHFVPKPPVLGQREAAPPPVLLLSCIPFHKL